MEQRENHLIADYIDLRAQRLEDEAAKDPRNSSYYKGVATTYRALASDIRAGLYK